MGAPLLQITGIGKTFGGSRALDDVDFEVAEGEIHALVGENGAGKSTLIKILAGVYKADLGEIRFKGRDGVTDVRKFPISFVHQDLGLVGTMTVAENIALVSGYAERRGLISWRAVADDARRVMDLMGVAIDVERPVSSLALAERSLVAIARGLAVDARLLILDEPTAALPAADVDRLFQVVRRLRDDGISVVHVTHRLDEVFEIGDRVTVLRDGRNVGTRRIGETTPADLVAMIVGRRLSDVFPTSPRVAGAPVLTLTDVETNQAGPVSLTLNSGEILGFVGLRGAGHDSIGRVIFGDTPMLGGRIVLHGRDVAKPRPLGMMRRGVGFVSSKRGEEALAETLSARENLFPRPAMGRATDSLLLKPRAEAREADAVVRKYGVRPRDPNLRASMFSGGNQQKIVLARWMELGSEVLILEEPTIGVDIGAKAEIYSLLVARLAAGGAVIVVSSDFEEVSGICHRALVFDRGRIVAELQREDLSQSTITRLASTTAADP